MSIWLRRLAVQHPLARVGAEVATYEFPVVLQLEHDLIDPSKGTQPVAYP